MRHVQSVINSISNVEVWANGATGLLNANSLNSLKTAVSGLSKEQALLVLSTKNLTQAQKEQVLIEAGIIASNNKINASIVQRALAESTLTAEQQKEILTKLELINVETGEVITTNACTKAALEEVLAKKGIVGADAEAIISSMGLTSANATQTISFDLLTASIWANIKALGKWLVTNPIGWAILGGTAIFGLVKAYDALTDSTEEVKERTDALLDSYNSAISEANSNAKTIESLASRYETLSKGVNNLGENVSLTADEYSEYNDIVNQIAEMFPTMITGYTDEGNAILSLKGNVEELRDAYKEAQKEAYNLLIVSGKDSDGNDIITNYQNQLHGNESFLSTTSSYIDGGAGAKDAIDVITRLTGALTPDEFRETYNQLYEEYENVWNSDKIQDALKSSGFEELTHAPKWSEITTEDLANVKYSAQATIQTYQAEIDSQLQNVRTLANAYLMTNSDYEKLDEQSKTAASLLVNSIDESIANGFENKSDVGAYVAELITSISNNAEAQNALTKLFTMDTTDMSIGEIQSEVDSYISIIADAIHEDSDKLKVRLGFEDVDTQTLINNVKGKLKGTEFDEKVGELNLGDLQIAAEQVDVPLDSIESWEELLSLIQKVKDETFNNKIDDLTILNQIQSLSDGLDQLDKLYADVKDKEGFDFSSLFTDDFKKTFGGFTEEYENLVKTITESPNDINACQSAFNDLATAYIYNTGALQNVTEETKSATIAMLEQMGVENADVLVSKALAERKADLAWQNEQVHASTADEIQALAEECGVTGEAKDAFYAYYAQKLIAENAMNTNGDIEALGKIIDALGLATSAWKTYYAAKREMESMSKSENQYTNAAGQKYYRYTDENGVNHIASQLAYDQKQKSLESKQKALEAEWEAKFSKPTTVYSGGSKSNSSGSSGSKQNKTFDWIQQKITYLRDEYSKYQEQIDDSNTSFRTQLNYLSEAQNLMSQIIDADKQAENAYLTNWQEVSANLSNELKDKIQYGDYSIDYFKDSEQATKAKEAWDKYYEQYKKTLEDEKTYQELQKSGLDKKNEWDKEDIERLKEKANIEQTNYEIQMAYLNQAVSKSENITKRLSDYADEANEKWEAAKETINSIDIAAIMRGELDLSQYENNLDYQKVLEEAIKAFEDKTDADKELEDAEIDLEERRKEAYEKAIEYVEAQIDYISGIKSTIESEMDLINATGGLVIEAQYEDLISQNEKVIKQYEEQIELINNRMSEVDEESADYYELRGQLEKCTQEINNAKAETAEWARTIELLPVERINKFLTMLDLIKRDLEDFMSWEITVGQANSQEEYQQLIDLESERIEKLKEQLEVQQGLLSNYEYGSDLYNDTLGEINDLADAIAQAATAQQEYNNALLNLPVDKITELNDELSHYKNIAQGQLDEQENALSAIIGLLQQEMDLLGKQQDEITEKYDQQTKPLQDQLDILNEKNEVLEAQKNLEQKIYDLEQVRNQKTTKVVRNGEIRYEADASAIRDAEEAVEDARLEKTKAELEESISNLEKLRDEEIDNLQNEIDRLDKIKSKWDDICKVIEQAIHEQNAMSILGEGWQDKILSGNDQQLYEDFFNLHSSTETQIDSLNKQIESNERIIEQTQIIIDRFNAQEMTLEEANDAIDKIVNMMSDGYSIDDQLNTQLGMDKVGSIDEFSRQIADKISDSMSILQESFAVADDNSQKIIEIMGNQADKLEEIRALDEENKRLYEEMLAKIAEMNQRYKNHSYNDSDSDDGDSSWGTGDRAQGEYTSNGDGHGSYDDYYDDDKDYTWHDGIENGTVGKASKSRLAFLKHIATEDLEPNERYVKVLEGEAIFTDGQQENLINNFQNASIPYFVPVIKPQTLPNNINKQGYINVEFNGDLNLPDVRDVDGFARALKDQFPNILRQQLSKRN